VISPIERIVLEWRLARAEGRAAAPRSQIGMRALELGRRELGNGEEGANNVGPDLERYRTDLRGRKGPAGAWCAALVAYLLEQACKSLGLEPPFVRSHRAKVLFGRLLKAGAAVTWPRAGDIGCMHRGAANAPTGHIFLVAEDYSPASGRYQALEGNRGTYPAPVDFFPRSLGEAGEIGFARLR
jgi:hypothetical protein